MPKTMRRHRQSCAGCRSRRTQFRVRSFIRSPPPPIRSPLQNEYNAIILDSVMINSISVVSREQLREYTISPAKSMGCNDRVDLHDPEIARDLCRNR
jgi:hypothetical protein